MHFNRGRVVFEGVAKKLVFVGFFFGIAVPAYYYDIITKPTGGFTNFIFLFIQTSLRANSSLKIGSAFKASALLSFPRYPNKNSDDSPTQPIIAIKNKKTPIILFWNLVYPATSDRALPKSFGAHAFFNCTSDYLPADQDCFFTHERNYLQSADSVVMQYRLWQRGDLPPKWFKRPPNQMWTFFIWESPAHVYSWDWKENKKAPRWLSKTMKGFFNWTMTYRLDSTVSYAYGRFRSRQKSPDMSRNYNRLENKTKTALWMAGNCDTASHREIYVQRLKEAGIDVDIIGRCNKEETYDTTSTIEKNCKRTGLFSTTDECNRLIGSRYKFYLAFENSLCKDYVTEKFYRAAMLDMIPVVMNGANMPLFAPPNSYIDTKDFESPKQLAAFLTKVGSNADLYNSYFHWKPYYNVEYTSEGWTFTKNLCQFCSKVHGHLSHQPTVSVYDDIERWWVTDGQCFEGKMAV